MQCSSRVTINQGRIKSLSHAAVKALEQTAEALHTEEVQAQVLPREMGTLQGEAFFVDKSESALGRVSLVNSTPYARRLYFHPEYHFHQEPWEKGEGNPNAKGKWHEDWMPGGSKEDFVPKTFQKILRRMVGQ